MCYVNSPPLAWFRYKTILQNDGDVERLLRLHGPEDLCCSAGLGRVGRKGENRKRPETTGKGKWKGKLDCSFSVVVRWLKYMKADYDY